MKKFKSFLVCFLMIVSFLSPLKSAFAEEQANFSSPNNLSGSIELPEIGKDRIDKLKEKIKKTEQKPVKKFTYTENEDIKK